MEDAFRTVQQSRDYDASPVDCSSRNSNSRQQARLELKRHSELSAKEKILNNYSPREIQRNQSYKKRPPIIKDNKKISILAELDNCGAKRCSHVAEEIASHLDKVETFKPELVAKLPQKENKKVFVTGPIEPRVHDVARLRSMLDKKNEPEEE